MRSCCEPVVARGADHRRPQSRRPPIDLTLSYPSGGPIRLDTRSRQGVILTRPPDRDDYLAQLDVPAPWPPQPSEHPTTPNHPDHPTARLECRLRAEQQRRSDAAAAGSSLRPTPASPEARTLSPADPGEPSPSWRGYWRRGSAVQEPRRTSPPAACESRVRGPVFLARSSGSRRCRRVCS